VRITDGYTVERLLGRGASAVVELARAPDGTSVAIKRVALTGSAAEIDRARRRIRREGEILTELRHPAIVPLLAVADDGADVLLVMPYASGGTLHDRITADGPMSPHQVGLLAGPLLDALATAHRHGVIHRDITPANILLTAGGEPMLADFGVATARLHTAGLTGDGCAFGTPGFMSPEQARGERATAASDVFSLAACLLFALRGAGPYGAGSPELLGWRASRGDLDPLPGDLPPATAAQLAAMLDPDPSRRPTAAAARGGPAGTLLAPQPAIVAATVNPPVAAPAATRHVRRWTIVAAAVATVAGVVAVVAARPSGDGRAAAATTVPPAPVTTVPCLPQPYQPCGQRSPAPFTDGARCTGNHDDYDGDRTNGCEAVPDTVDGAELTPDAPVVANIVPAADVDSYRLHVTDKLQLLCDGSVAVRLTAPPGVADRVDVLRDGKVVATALATEGRTATARVDDPSCLHDDTGWLTVRVSAVAGRTAADYRLETSGHL